MERETRNRIKYWVVILIIPEFSRLINFKKTYKATQLWKGYVEFKVYCLKV